MSELAHVWKGSEVELLWWQHLGINASGLLWDMSSWIKMKAWLQAGYPQRYLKEMPFDGSWVAVWQIIMHSYWIKCWVSSQSSCLNKHNRTQTQLFYSVIWWYHRSELQPELLQPSVSACTPSGQGRAMAQWGHTQRIVLLQTMNASQSKMPKTNPAFIP